MLGHVVDEHTDPGRKMLAAEIAEVVAAVFGCVLRETTDQLPFARQIAFSQFLSRHNPKVSSRCVTITMKRLDRQAP